MDKVSCPRLEYRRNPLPNQDERSAEQTLWPIPRLSPNRNMIMIQKAEKSHGRDLARKVTPRMIHAKLEKKKGLKVSRQFFGYCVL